MTDANPRDLIRRLADALNDLSQHLEAESPAPAVQNAHKAWKEARAYLAQPEPEPDDPDYYLAWLLFACDGKLRPEAQRVLAAHGVTQPKPPNLKEQALLKLKELQALLQFENVDSSCIRRALEQLPDPS